MSEKLQWVLLSLLILAVGVLGIIAWENRTNVRKLSDALSALSEQVRTNQALISSHVTETQAAATAAASAWTDAVNKLPACGAAQQDLPDAATLATLGFKSLQNSGYAPARVCLDKGSEMIAFIMAKKELTKPTPESEPACVDSCDKVVFGLLDPKLKTLKYLESADHLGIYGEAYDQYCLIDKALNGAGSAERLLLYCGSGESGGLNSWYQYEFQGDKLTTVQTLLQLGPPETYDVKAPDLLQLFGRKTNAAQ